MRYFIQALLLTITTQLLWLKWEPRIVELSTQSMTQEWGKKFSKCMRTHMLTVWMCFPPRYYVHLKVLCIKFPVRLSSLSLKLIHYLYAVCSLSNTHYYNKLHCDVNEGPTSSMETCVS